MDIPNLIRAAIFFVAGILVIAFPKQVFDWQIRTIKRLAKIFSPFNYFVHKFTSYKKHYIRTNFVTGIIFLIIAGLLFVYAIL